MASCRCQEYGYVAADPLDDNIIYGGKIPAMINGPGKHRIFPRKVDEAVNTVL
jgi:hypothetical protein